MQHDIRNATCSIRHARCNLKLATCNIPKCKQHHATCKSQNATCNAHQPNATRDIATEGARESTHSAFPRSSCSFFTSSFCRLSSAAAVGPAPAGPVAAVVLLLLDLPLRSPGADVGVRSPGADVGGVSQVHVAAVTSVTGADLGRGNPPPRCRRRTVGSWGENCAPHWAVKFLNPSDWLKGENCAPHWSVQFIKPL